MYHAPLITLPLAVFLKNFRWVTTASARDLFLIEISTITTKGHVMEFSLKVGLLGDRGNVAVLICATAAMRTISEISHIELHRLWNNISSGSFPVCPFFCHDYQNELLNCVRSFLVCQNSNPSLPVILFCLLQSTVFYSEIPRAFSYLFVIIIWTSSYPRIDRRMLP